MENSNSIAKSAILVTLMMLAFKVVAFAKQAVIAYYFGATVETDIYFIAWGFVSGISEAIVKALGVSVVAIYTTIRVTKGKEEAARLVNGLLEVILPLFFLLTCVIMAFAPSVSWILAPSYKADSLALLVIFMQILAPLLLFTGTEFVFSAVLDSHKSFFIPRLHSFIYSVVVILACIFLSGKYGIGSLVIAQYVSSFVFLCVMFVSIKKYHSLFLVKLSDIPELRTVLYTGIPLFIGNSAVQINQIVDKSITSSLGAGATSALSYCHSIEQLITNIMIVNIGNVMFANFAEFVARGDLDKIKNVLFKAINMLICLLVAISVFTVIFAKEIVSIIYLRGNFTYDAMAMTALALCGYAVSFVAVAVRDLSVKSLYAFKNTKSPMIASTVSIIVNIFFSLLLSRYIGILGVSLATSISVLVGMVLNAMALKRYLVGYEYLKHLIMLKKCLPALILFGGVCIFVEKFVLIGLYGKFLCAVIVGFLSYFSVLYFCGVEEISVIYKQIKLKVKK